MADAVDGERRQTVLIVDDAPENIAIISSLLKGLCRARVATSGEKALEVAYSADPPDLILLDVMMPGMDGYEVCRRLKADDRSRSIPVIFLTAKSEVADEQKGFTLGAVDYITKPISPPIVVARVKTHLNLRRAAEELRAAYEDLDREFRSVGDVQASLLPERLPDIPGFEAASHYRPARRAGGDAFDLIPLPEGRWGVGVSDVSGHGAPSAVIMAMTHILMRTASAQISAGQMLSYLNEAMVSHVRSDRFVTACYGILDPAAGTFSFSSAGHPPPLLWRARTRLAEDCSAEGGPPLAMLPSSTYGEAAVAIAPGDVLVLYTDGITEAADAAGEMFGADRLKRAVESSATRGAEAALDAILGALDAHRGAVELADDVTLLVLRCASSA